MRGRQPDRQDFVERNGIKDRARGVRRWRAGAAARPGSTHHAWTVVEDDRSIARRAFHCCGHRRARHRSFPELRMVVVTGPRIDPAQFPQYAGLELHSYVHRLYAHLCVCDLAVVQGGLTTTMELTAAKRPFLYFPLAHHFEQNFHVRHRLDRYRAGECMDYSTSDPDLVAARIAQLIGKRVDYVDVETDGAARAARKFHPLCRRAARILGASH
jgi:hypothetical protein